MKILHRYILSQLLRNLALSLMIFVFLFLVFDFFDRIDNILAEDTSLFVVLQYFLYKIPLTINLMLPVAMLVSTMFTIGVLSKNSEITAMRASGLKIYWLSRPLLVVGFVLSLVSIILNETIVPYTTRRVREIYNIDIKEKNTRGNYSQNDFWWRSGDTFFSVNMFDSRNSTLLNLSKLEMEDDFRIAKRTVSEKASWINPTLAWNMEHVSEYTFPKEGATNSKSYKALPLPIEEEPQDFYKAKTDPHTMSFLQLREFIKQQESNGLSTRSYMADLNAKISFPFVIFIVTLAAIPFALSPARSGSMAASFIAGLIIGFSYYAVHSFSIAMGRAEFWPPLIAAWMATFLLGIIGLILNAGAESPG